VISTIVLSYNVPDKLVLCVSSLLAQPEIKELVLIENHSVVSMDDAYGRIRGMCEHSGVDFIFYKPEQALSFSEGQNWGIEHAKHDTILLMNNDAAIMYPNTLYTSLTFLVEDVAIVGHKIMNPDQSCNHLGIFFDGITKYTDHLGRDCAVSDYLQNPVLAVTAACMLLKKSQIRFDRYYWFEYEDMDFCLQHIRLGKKIVCNTEMPVIHEESTTRAEPQATNKIWQEKQRVGRSYFYKKWRWFLILRTWKVFTQWDLLPDAYKAHLHQTIGDVIGIVVAVGVLVALEWRVADLGWLVSLFQILALGLGFIVAKAGGVFILKKLT
jgi:GT2 family glycosyltransferase